MYADLICGLCSPSNQNEFKIINSELTIDISMDTCSDFLEMWEFELRTSEIY